MLLPPRIPQWAMLGVCLAAAIACQPKIGDDCATGTDCSQTGGRTCDTTMPGGYCTILGCDPDTCPEEAACIAFLSAPSTLNECQSLVESRQMRTFCMRRCSSQDDCRVGYECTDLNSSDGTRLGAQRIDQGSADGRVCMLKYEAAAAVDATGGATSDYCKATRYEDKGYYAVGGSASWSDQTGTAGSAGVAGAAAQAGSAGATGSIDGHAGTSGSVAGGAGAPSSGS